ncbi:MAG: hypothetical protein ACTHU0_39530 [Kofleriaceae bacterium]
MELVLWLCFLVPGIVYSLWRTSQQSPQCATCGSREIVPLASPRGEMLAADVGLRPGDVDVEMARIARAQDRRAPLWLWVVAALVVLQVLGMLLE